MCVCVLASHLEIDIYRQRVCVVSRHSNIQDTSSQLLQSFCDEDIADIVKRYNQAEPPCPRRARRIYSDVFQFFEGVCKDLLVLYPECTKDKPYFTQLFSRSLDTNVNEE